LKSFGAWAFIGVLVIVFVECGLLLGIVLPGDSLLFITGLFIVNGTIDVNIYVAVVLITISAILGNLVGYWVGAKIGPALFSRKESRFFKQEYVERTAVFFEKHGSRAIVLARFTPIVRTLITASAGIGKMPFKTYAIYSSIGGVLWVGSMTLLGYYFGTVPFIADHLEALTVAIVVLSVIPIAVEMIRAKRATK
jgi:membrane-associated protein